VKIRTMFLLNMTLFGIILVIVCLSVLFTGTRVEYLRDQEDSAHTIERSANDLVFLSHEYILYREDQLYRRWNMKFTSILDELSGLKPDTAPERAAAENIREGCRRIRTVFEDMVTAGKPGSSNGGTNGALKLNRLFFSRMAVQNKGIIFDAEQLSKLLRERAESMKRSNDILSYAMIGVFILFFLVNYIIFYRRTLESIARLRAGARAVGSGNLSYRIRTRKKDEIGELSLAFNRMAAGLKKITASKKDLEAEVASRKKAEDALRISEERFATTLASIGDAVVSTDVDGRIVFMNGIAEQLTGWSNKEALGRNSDEVFRIINEETREPVKNPVNSVLKNGVIMGLANHTLLIRKDGTEIPIDDSGAPIKDRSNRLNGVVLVFRDITERRRAEEILERDRQMLEQLVSEKSKELLAAEQEVTRVKRLSDIGMLASFVAHELRNPLAVIATALYNIQKKAADAPIDRHVQNIQKKITESEQIINNLLFFARIKPPQMQDMNIHEVIHECVDTVRENMKKNISFNLNTDQVHGVPVRMDPVQIREVFHNILNNACDAVPEGTGTIDIEAANEHNHVRIRFKDDGQGIGLEHIGKIFDPFFTTKTKGTGLGLAVCKQILSLHQGSITVESHSGKGTSVVITLPREQGGES
jgi:PAS domain S-box-containing protein